MVFSPKEIALQNGIGVIPEVPQQTPARERDPMDTVKIDDDLFQELARIWRESRYPEPTMDTAIRAALNLPLLHIYTGPVSQLILYGRLHEKPLPEPQERHAQIVEVLVGELVAFTPGAVALYTRKDGPLQQFAGMAEVSRNEKKRESICIIRSFFGNNRCMEIHADRGRFDNLHYRYIRWGIASPEGLKEERRIIMLADRCWHIRQWLNHWLPSA